LEADDTEVVISEATHTWYQTPRFIPPIQEGGMTLAFTNASVKRCQSHCHPLWSVTWIHKLTWFGRLAVGQKSGHPSFLALPSTLHGKANKTKLSFRGTTSQPCRGTTSQPCVSQQQPGTWWVLRRKHVDGGTDHWSNLDWLPAEHSKQWHALMIPFHFSNRTIRWSWWMTPP
jgi:hypothetical protein